MKLILKIQAETHIFNVRQIYITVGSPTVKITSIAVEKLHEYDKDHDVP